MEESPATTIALGVSSCLLGERVRYDGGHKLDRYITGSLARFFRFVPVCPEVECGLPTPREAMHLEGDPNSPRLVTVKTHRDLTEQMADFCSNKVEELVKEDLCGFIFKKNSPSSGLFRVKVYNRGMPTRSGSGLFADAVAKRFPLLPVEEEGRLNDPQIRENFLERVFSCHRWKSFMAHDPQPGKLVEFHTAHKLLMMAHSPTIYGEMGRLVAAAGTMPRDKLFGQYEQLMMKGLSLNATPRKNTNVLMHVMGYFKKHLSREEKEELLGVIGQYHDGLIPLIVPVTLIRHYVMKFDQAYLKKQVYLSPHPAELMLRNHV